MKRMMTAFVAGLAVLGAPAFAQTNTLPPDSDGDGVWSLEEMQAVLPDMTEDMFKAIDSDGDGSVNPDELQAAIGAGLVTLPN